MDEVGKGEGFVAVDSGESGDVVQCGVAGGDNSDYIGTGVRVLVGRGTSFFVGVGGHCVGTDSGDDVAWGTVCAGTWHAIDYRVAAQP